MTGFHIHHNHVHHSGSGIGSNGSSGGLIEANTVTYLTGHGLFCGGPASDVVFDNNLISDNDLFGLWVSCWGDNITVRNNRIGNNCRKIPGGGAGLLADSKPQFGRGDGLEIRDNLVIEPICQSASLISFRNHVQMSGNDFRAGNMATVIFKDASQVEMSDSQINGENSVQAGIFLHSNVDGLTVRRDVQITGYTGQRVMIGERASVTNLVVE